MRSPIQDPKLRALLGRLHEQSDTQVPGIAEYLTRRVKGGALGGARFDEDAHRFLRDKMVALDREKAEFCYLLCRSLRAERIVEAGTSFGVSTIYLATALRDNKVENGVVIGTEYEPEKARAARANFKEAGLDSFVDLREGDLRNTLRNIDGPIDFLLLDIWEVALDALTLVYPHLRSGSVIVCDNTAVHAEHYREFFQFVSDPAYGLLSMTVPFTGGLELIVRA